ncbi:hypothetical protein O6P43_034557 [Quillaja saponaria]|uniref:Uncharacterized protein n=1 Tax=Quillaja saponaria TaxID=32244 RepID=A0AAD7KMW2_QUISA|nr:hypothetical protein O6P43_034557 [Quillaja saponaria]
MSRGRGLGGRRWSYRSSGSKDLVHLSAKDMYLKSLKEDPSMCQIMYDYYLECVKRDGADECKHYDEKLALCPDAVSGKLPRVHAVAQFRKMVEEERQRAVSKGFSNYREHMLSRMKADPYYCKRFFYLYEKCLSEGHNDCEDYFERYPWCPQFKKEV